MMSENKVWNMVKNKSLTVNRVILIYRTGESLGRLRPFSSQYAAA